MAALECAICCIDYNQRRRRPVIGNCGHTFCLSCSEKFQNRQCPTCRTEGAFSRPIVNYAVVEQLDPSKASEQDDEPEEPPSQLYPNITGLESDFQRGMNLDEDLDYAMALALADEEEIPISRSRTVTFNIPRRSSLPPPYTPSIVPSAPPMFESKGTPKLLKGLLKGLGHLARGQAMGHHCYRQSYTPCGPCISACGYSPPPMLLKKHRRPCTSSCQQWRFPCHPW